MLYKVMVQLNFAESLSLVVIWQHEVILLSDIGCVTHIYLLLIFCEGIHEDLFSA